MNIKRLTILRDALIEHAKDQGNLRFNLSDWADIPSQYRGENPLDVIRGAGLGRNYCGTTACACGLAMSLPELQAEGLKHIRSAIAGMPIPAYRNVLRWDAVQQFFDISSDDAHELFSTFSYEIDEETNPVAVADKITALLETA